MAHKIQSHTHSCNTGVSSGTGISCEFCEILKKTFFAKNPQWLLLAFTPIEISYSNAVCNKWAAEVWICLVSLHGGAKDFIFTCIFLRIITIFIKIWIWHRIFSISVTGLKFNTQKTIIHLMLLTILKTYVHYLRHRFINQKSNIKAGVHIFTNIKNTDSSK